MDCSAAIDRVEQWKITNTIGEWEKSLEFQCKDYWKVWSSIVQPSESFKDASESRTVFDI